ncbi:MAG: pirin family protein [Bacteroidales bacterium]
MERNNSDNVILEIGNIGFHWTMEDPFIFCAHHKDAFPVGNMNMGPNVSLEGRNIGSDFSGKDGFSMYHGDIVPGFPEHPHRGFETVTIVLEGVVDHFDSKGAYGRYADGDVQWLTTGKGCQHCEMFPLINQDKENPLELFQVWLNLPKKDKFVEPNYKMLWREDIPIFDIVDENNNRANIRLIAGSFFGRKALEPTPNSWANDERNRVGIVIIRMEPNSKITIEKGTKTMSRNLYFYKGEGKIKIGDTDISSSNRIRLDAEKEFEIQNLDKTSYILLLEGERIDEPIVQQGPFVMNSEEEIYNAIKDFRQTQFGGWKWDRPDPVNDINTGRFARYDDGKEEVKF